MHSSRKMLSLEDPARMDGNHVDNVVPLYAD